MRRYTDDDRKDAFSAYKSLGTLPRVSEVLDIPIHTIERWSAKYQWLKKIEDERASLVPKPTDHEYEVAKLSKKLGLTESDSELLVQVRKIESVVFSSIYKTPTDREGTPDEDHLNLKPVSFDSAMRALKICWDTRDKLFSKKNSIQVPEGKVNYIGQVNQYYNSQEEDDITIQGVSRESMVSKQLPDSERGDYYETE